MAAMISPVSAQDQNSWVDAMIIPKEAGTRMRMTDNAGRSVDLGVLNRMVYVVLKEQGPWIMVRQYGKEGWLLKGEAVFLDDAPAYFSERIRNNPADDRAWALRGEAFRWKGQLENSIQDLTEAIRLNPGNPAWHNNRALGYHNKRDENSAIADYTAAIRLDPTDAFAFYNRGNSFRITQEFGKAIADYLEAIRLQPLHPNPHNAVAWIWATCPNNEFRDGQKALEHARRACELENWRRANDWGTLAAAYAETGRFEEARKWQSKALEDALYARTYEEQGKERLKLYSQGKAYREDMSQFARK
jgi:tetratricopeptide (TPR) repeat protein